MMRTHSPIYVYILSATLAVLTACGGVLTPEPGAGTSPTGTPTASPRVQHDATVTAPPLPPADTATPTVSPTPIIHIVQAGDTLLGIALDYGVSVEAIQAANGIEDPQFLRIGQELIIPTGEEPSDSPSGLLLPTPTPESFTLQGIAFYETPVGSVWCLGEIVNPFDFPLTNVQVRVTLFDEAGMWVADGDVFAAADLIPPGERSPFGIMFTDPPASWASSQVTIVRGEAAGELAASYVPIAVVGSEGQPVGPQFEVTGQVQNSSATQSASRVSIIATAYDAQGAVTGFRQGTVALEEPLAPGATAPFTLLFDLHGDVPTDFGLIALGYLQ